MSESTVNSTGATDASEDLSTPAAEQKTAAQRVIEAMNAEPFNDEVQPELPVATESAKVEEVKEEPPAEEVTTEEENPKEEETETEEEPEKVENESEIQKVFKEHPRLLAMHLDNKRKREERTAERDKALAAKAQAEAEAARLKGELEALNQQLAQASRPAPTPNDPLADVYDEASLRRAEAQFEEVIELAEKNPDGAYDVVVGKNPDGSEKKRDFTRDELIQLKIVAQRGLRRDIPQRQAFLAQRAQMDAKAVEVYPELQDKNSDLNKFIQSVEQADPVLVSRIGPEFRIWAANAFVGRDLLVKRLNGKSTNGSESVRKIVTAPKKVAPSIPKQRGDQSVSGEREIAEAYKAYQENPTEDNLAAWYKAKREANARQAAVS